MKRSDLIKCLYNSAAMLLLADSHDPDNTRRAACRKFNAGQAGFLREAAAALEAGEALEDDRPFSASSPSHLSSRQPLE